MSPGGSDMWDSSCAQMPSQAGCTSEDKMKIKFSGGERIMKEFRRAKYEDVITTTNYFSE